MENITGTYWIDNGMIRKTENFSFKDKLPVVAQTAFTREADVRKIKESLFDGYISKPIDEYELLKKIQTLLGKR